MKWLLAIIFLSLFQVLHAAAAPTITETQPVEGDPFKDFRIENCDAKFGLALIQYDTLGGPFVISDFCIDAKNARFTGAEIKQGFELVSDSRAGQKFDIPSTRDRAYPPTSFTILREDNALSCHVEGVTSFDYPLYEEELERFPEFDFAYATGFTYDKVGALPTSVEPTEVLLSLTNFNQYDIKEKSLKDTELPTGTGIYSSLVMSGVKGTLDVIEGDGYSTGDASGTLSVEISPDGEVSLAGSFEAKSLDKNGQDYSKWIAIRGQVKYFRGYFFGEPARQIRGFGLVEGSLETVSGDVYLFRSDVSMAGCLQ
ncbi:MAG: hypothetical protein ACSHYC_12780 [Alphaproteobacteria bacterium]